MAKSIKLSLRFHPDHQTKRCSCKKTQLPLSHFGKENAEFLKVNGATLINVDQLEDLSTGRHYTVNEGSHEEKESAVWCTVVLNQGIDWKQASAI